MPDDLTILQENFAAALLDPNLVNAALTTLSGHPDLNRDRIALYRGNIVAIWQQSCAAAFPVLKRLTGAEFFDELARAYGHTCPSLTGNLTDFGAGMAAYIETLENCRPYPYLSDSAALEWLVHRAYYLERKEPATLTQLACVATNKLSEVCFELQPGCALLASGWAIADLWLVHQNEEVILPPELKTSNWCLVWQSGWKIQVSSISEASYIALQALQESATLGTALERSLEIDPEFDVQTALADWFQKQLITSIISTT